MYCDLWISKFKKEQFPRKLYEEIRYSFDRLDVKFGDSKRLEEIIGIYETNKFNGGVGIQASRFNHSCCSNAEGVWNKEDGSREFRIVKKVKSGETPCYQPKSSAVRILQRTVKISD